MVRTIDVDFVEHVSSGKSKDLAQVLTKARAHYDQTTPASLGQSLAVSSYTDTSAGVYTVNFSFTWTISTYAAFRTAHSDNPRSAVAGYNNCHGSDQTHSTTAQAAITSFGRAAGAGFYDSPDSGATYAGE